MATICEFIMQLSIGWLQPCEGSVLSPIKSGVSLLFTNEMHNVMDLCAIAKLFPMSLSGGLGQRRIRSSM